MTEPNLNNMSLEELKIYAEQVAKKISEVSHKKPILKKLPTKPKLKIKMKLLPPDIVEELKKGREDSTIRSINFSIERLCRDIFQIDQFKPDLFIKEQQRVIDTVSSSASRRTLIGCLLVVLEAYKIPEDQYGLYKERMKAWHSVGKVKVTNKEIDNLLSIADVEKLREDTRKLIEKSPSLALYHRFLVLSIYSYLPPLRQGELLSCQIKEFNKGDDLKTKITEDLKNFICLTNKKLVITDCKTKKNFSIRIIDVPDQLATIVKDFSDRFQSKFLIPLASNVSRPMSSSGFSHYLNSIFGKKVSVDMLRKVYISEKCPKMTDEERNKLSYIMGHSVVTQELVYKKFETSIIG
jgi:hypothetical protein